MNYKILLILNHAPHYRENFLRILGRKFNLTVFAKPCSTANLIEPQSRANYIYEESISKRFFLKFGLQVNKGEWRILQKKWDKIILSWDLHHIYRYLFFLLSRTKNKVIWMGHIYGTRDSKLLRLSRRLFINSSGGVLTYSDNIKQRLLKDGIKVPIWSFNNSEVSIKEIKCLPFNFISDKIKLLYVGRYQERKKLDRLVKLAKQRADVEIIIAGNEMDKLLKKYPEINAINNIHIKGSVLGKELENLMGWSDIIVNPGHLGLLVVNGARYGRPIIVDNRTKHAPEVIVAKEAAQFFIDWNDLNIVNEQINKLIQDRKIIQEASKRLVEVVKSRYTVEYMAEVFEKALMI